MLSRVWLTSWGRMLAAQRAASTLHLMLDMHLLRVGLGSGVLRFVLC